MSAMRPNRSDVHVSLEEERKIEEKTREQFDAIAPKRHTKPQRSDYSSDYSDSQRNFDRDINIPELIKFQHLESDDPQVYLVYKLVVFFNLISYIYEEH
ncbi:hypothetical protein AQUCO_00900766v1 [Aquilegia coerulea]|uniref:Uncharacterized protein n=1 Tax=Aquilegia coerulea TaxID=218851 RepID=A0A2G5EFA9_AQUCA|nr:hypothetical protein AQUCO_00900766v1 [Aquilegia coerulea]PIA54446.1 hypothetical protein AQUCO_00900766v1 [Aquilegia coerulea]